MEELLILILQLVIELFINIPWDLFFYSEPKSDLGAGLRVGILSLIVGGIIGLISVVIFPNVFAKHEWIRLLLLLIGPPLGGLAAYSIAKLKSRTRHYVCPSLHFWWSFFFSLGYMAVRFAFAHRPLL